MELKVYWTDFAKSKLKDIYTYYCENANLYISKKIVAEIIQHTLILPSQCEMGSKRGIA